MKISVITVCYNAENAIAKTIKSVLEQETPELEYIIIDGMSLDGTLQIIDQYRDKIAYFVSEPDEGIYDAMNKGIKAATGDHVFFLNAGDTFVDSEVVNSIVENLKVKPVDILYGDVLVAEQKGIVRKSHAGIDKLYFLYNTICHQAIFFSAKSFRQIGLYDKNLRIAADFEWLLRAMEYENLTWKYIDRPIALFNRDGISSNASSKAVHQAEKDWAIKLHFSRAELRQYRNPVIARLAQRPSLRPILCKIFQWQLNSR